MDIVLDSELYEYEKDNRLWHIINKILQEIKQDKTLNP